MAKSPGTIIREVYHQGIFVGAVSYQRFGAYKLFVLPAPPDAGAGQVFVGLTVGALSYAWTEPAPKRSR